MEVSVSKKTPIHNIEWLVNPCETVLPSSTIGASSDTKRIQFPYPPEMATGFSEHTQTRDGIVLVQDTHNFIQGHCPPTVPLGTFSVQFTEPVLALSTVHTGQLLMTDLKSKKPCSGTRGQTASRIASTIQSNKL